MKVIYLIGFAYVDKPSFPYLTLPECGFWTEKTGAQAECDKRNKIEQEIAQGPEYSEFTQGFWSVRESFLNK